MKKTNTEVEAGANTEVVVSADVRDRVLKEFKRYEPYNECLRDLEEKNGIYAYEDKISYHCSSNIETDVRTASPPSSGGQPERDALRMSGVPDQIIVIKQKIASLENALNTASRTAQIHCRKKVFTALYENLVVGVPASALKKSLKMSHSTLMRYRERAIYEAAVNLKYIPANK